MQERCLLHLAEQALHTSSVPDTLEGRSDKVEQIQSFLRSALDAGRGGSLYLCGGPGTGKTSCVVRSMGAGGVDMGLRLDDGVVLCCVFAKAHCIKMLLQVRGGVCLVMRSCQQALTRCRTRRKECTTSSLCTSTPWRTRQAPSAQCCLCWSKHCASAPTHRQHRSISWWTHYNGASHLGDGRRPRLCTSAHCLGPVCCALLRL